MIVERIVDAFVVVAEPDGESAVIAGVRCC